MGAEEGVEGEEGGAHHVPVEVLGFEGEVDGIAEGVAKVGDGFHGAPRGGEVRILCGIVLEGSRKIWLVGGSPTPPTRKGPVFAPRGRQGASRIFST